MLKLRQENLLRHNHSLVHIRSMKLSIGILTTIIQVLFGFGVICFVVLFWTSLNMVLGGFWETYIMFSYSYYSDVGSYVLFVLFWKSLDIILSGFWEACIMFF